MVMNVAGLSNWGPYPGSPAPITFGMSRDPSQSMSLNPGAGNLGALGSYQGGGAGGGGGLNGVNSGQGAIPAGWKPDSSMSVTNLSPVNVTAATLGGAPMLGDLYSGGGGGSFGMPAGTGVAVKDLAPVHVTAQMPVQPTWLDHLYMMQNDHPVLANVAKGLAGNIPLLGPVIATANAYENYKHGRGMLYDLAQLFHGGAASTPTGGSGGSPLSATPQHPLYADLYNPPIVPGGGGSGDGGAAHGVGGGPALAASGALPAYPGLSALSGGSAPLGGFWNQRALHDAAPVYGPYAAFGPGTPSYLPAGAQFAPAGILGA